MSPERHRSIERAGARGRGSASEGPVNAILDLRHLVALLVEPLRFQRNVHAHASPGAVLVGKAIQVVLMPGVHVAAAGAHPRSGAPGSPAWLMIRTVGDWAFPANAGPVKPAGPTRLSAPPNIPPDVLRAGGSRSGPPGGKRCQYRQSSKEG